MWAFIFGGMIILAIAGFVFLWTRFQKFGIVNRLSGNRKWLRRLIALIPMVIFGFFIWIDTVNTVIVLVHMAIYWVLAELIASVVKKLGKKNSDKAGTGKEASIKSNGSPYIVGIIVLCFELLYFCTALYLNYHVWEKDYQLSTGKDIGVERIRIAQITDSHLGTTFDGEGFAKHMSRIQEAHPDILVITGDFVDDDSNREDLIRSCEALKEFEAPLGKYYVYGNHDKGYYGRRDFTADEMEVYRKGAGVEVLKDDVRLIDDRLYIVGRKDASDGGREEISELISPLDASKYTVILDHQPTDYAAEAATGADLVLSGHTHGGQTIELALAAMLMGANDKTYGIETRDKTTFIVSSGISDWAIKFKTGTRSEFCVIDIREKSEI